MFKISRRRLIELFVKHRYWYNQGNNTLATLSVIPIEKIAIIAASVKYLLGDHVSPELIYSAAGAYLIYRVVIRWLIGYIWHRSDGYDIESEWNKGKVPPSRVEVINLDELIAKWKELSHKSEYFPDTRIGCVAPGPVLVEPGVVFLAPDGIEIKKRPDYVHPDDGWLPNPNSGPRERIEKK